MNKLPTIALMAATFYVGYHWPKHNNDMHLFGLGTSAAFSMGFSAGVIKADDPLKFEWADEVTSHFLKNEQSEVDRMVKELVDECQAELNRRNQPRI